MGSAFTISSSNLSEGSREERTAELSVWKGRNQLGMREKKGNDLSFAKVLMNTSAPES